MRRPQSYSSISLYKKCPKQWEWSYVLGNRKPPGAAADRGTMLHLKLEEFFLGKTPYPSQDKVLRPWQRFMENLTTFNPSPEGELAVLEDWTPCTFEDPEAYARGKVDLLLSNGRCRNIYDWKSGRVYPDHPNQGKMYMALDEEPGGTMEEDLLPTYRTHFVYLDIPNHVDSRDYIMADRYKEIETLRVTIDGINSATEYPATPSHESCQWCPLSWRRGGDCRAAP